MEESQTASETLENNAMLTRLTARKTSFATFSGREIVSLWPIISAICQCFNISAKSCVLSKMSDILLM